MFKDGGGGGGAGGDGGDGDAARNLADKLASGVDPLEEARRRREEAARAAEEEAARQREEEEAELARLQAELDRLELERARFGEERGDAAARTRHLEALLGGLDADGKKMERDYLVLKKMFDMLPNAAANMQKLQQICAQSAQRLVKLGAEWELHRRPLVAAHRAHKDALARRKQGCRRKVADMKAMRKEMKAIAAQVRRKEEEADLLRQEYERMPKTINRALYTYRIMDIIKQVRKQKHEIGRIIADIRRVQKAINVESEKLKRTEALADEQLFQAANSKVNAKGKKQKEPDPAYLKSYRNLTELRHLFDDLLRCVKDIGDAENATRDLGIKSDALEARNTSNNMEKILSDLKEVKAENKALLRQLRGDDD